MTPRPASILDAARNLVTAGWSRAYEAENRHGESVAFDSADAVCFCPAAAIMRAAMPSPLGEDAYWALAALWRAITESGAPLGHEHGSFYIDAIASWSKALERTQAAVVDAFGRAIVIAEEWEREVEAKAMKARIREGAVA